MAYCGRCGVLRPNYFFIHHRTLTLTSLCAVCRKEDEQIPCMTDIIAFVDSSIIGAVAQVDQVLVGVIQAYKANILLQYTETV